MSDTVRARDVTATILRARRRIAIGAFVGAVASALWLVPTAPSPAVALAIGVTTGIGFAVTLRRAPGAWIDGGCTAATLAIVLWGLEISFGRAPTFARLIDYLFFGFSVGAGAAILRDLVARIVSPEADAPPAARVVTREVVILGGGFAGVETARAIERQIRGDRSIGVTIVSETNALLFTPMLAEVAASSIEPTHISTPLRSTLRRSTVVLGRVTSIDLARRRIVLDDGARIIDADQLVLALGSVSNFLGLENVARLALGFRTLGDAIRIRNRAIAMLERADRESDERARRTLLTFVVAGGGFAGAELAGALNDFVRGARADYRNVAADEIAIVLVHAGERILPELSASLGTYAQSRMMARGVTIRLKTRVSDVEPDRVHFADGTTLAAETLVWTAGTKPNDIIGALGMPTDRRGAIVVDETLAVPGVAGVWALGDCASALDSATGRPYAPTAQVAIREAVAVARNICATLADRPATGARIASLGALCVVGHRTACAELMVPFARGRSLRFSGTFAWLLWRGVYLVKLPGFERQTRVLFDWVVELFFPRDIAQTLDLR